MPAGNCEVEVGRTREEEDPGPFTVVPTVIKERLAAKGVVDQLLSLPRHVAGGL